MTFSSVCMSTRYRKRPSQGVMSVFEIIDGKIHILDRVQLIDTSICDRF